MISPASASLKQTIDLIDMKGYIYYPYRFPLAGDASALPAGMPLPRQPLLDYESYRKWGRFLEWDRKVVKSIKDEPLSEKEVENFNEHNKYCIEAFKFIVWLLNRDDGFPCRECPWLCARMRVLFKNDFYLIRFTDKNPSVFQPVGSSRILSPLQPCFRLEEYYALSKDDKSKDMTLDRCENLSLFMPCVWEMLPKKQDDGVCSKLSRSLEELEERRKELAGRKNGSIKKEEYAVDYQSNIKAAIALYKATLMLFSFYEDNHSGQSAMYDSGHPCKFFQEFWPTKDYSSFKCAMPSFVMVPNFKKNLALYKDVLILLIDITAFFIGLLLCKYKTVCFTGTKDIADRRRKILRILKAVESENIKAKDTANHRRKISKKLNAVESENKKARARNTFNCIISFDESISSEDKDKIILRFICDIDYEIKDEDFLNQLKNLEAFSLSYHSGADTLHFLFDKNNFFGSKLNNNVDVNRVRIIRGTDFYDRLKNPSEDSPPLKDICNQSILWIYFNAGNNQQKSEDGKKIKFINKNIKGRKLKDRIWIISQEKTSLSNIIRKKCPGLKSEAVISDLNDAAPVSLQNLYMSYNDYRKIIDSKAQGNGIRTAEVLSHLYFEELTIDNISRNIREKLKIHETADIPAHYLKPTRERESPQKSWFLRFTEKHKSHNLCVLTVVFSIMYSFYMDHVTIKESQIETLVKDLKKALRRQNDKKWDKSTQGRIKYQNEDAFFMQKLKATAEKVCQIANT